MLEDRALTLEFARPIGNQFLETIFQERNSITIREIGCGLGANTKCNENFVAKSAPTRLYGYATAQ